MRLVQLPIDWLCQAVVTLLPIVPVIIMFNLSFLYSDESSIWNIGHTTECDESTCHDCGVPLSLRNACDVYSICYVILTFINFSL